jgi:hypothetical protein
MTTIAPKTPPRIFMPAIPYFRTKAPFLMRILHANRYPPRIKSGAGFTGKRYSTACGQA